MSMIDYINSQESSHDSAFLKTLLPNMHCDILPLSSSFLYSYHAAVYQQFIKAVGLL